ncbi:hypothetical protein FOA52_005493 [Chlamydomonas sp. UWO 241]|nr:hypothetical protein FOA52_005493 [Chlamydomonas sp. UWO 241]
MRDKPKQHQPEPSTTRGASIDPGDYCYPATADVCHQLMMMFMFHHGRACTWGELAGHCAPPPFVGGGGTAVQSIAAARLVNDAHGYRPRRHSRDEGAVENESRKLKARTEGGSSEPWAPPAPPPTPFGSPLVDVDVGALLPRGALPSLLLIDDGDDCGGIYSGGGTGTTGGAYRAASSPASLPSSGVSSCCADALSEMCNIETLYSFVANGNADDALFSAWQLSGSWTEEESQGLGCTGVAFCPPRAW